MRHYTLSTLLCMVALVLLAGCSSGTASGSSATPSDPCGKSSNVKGTITSIKNVTNRNFVGSFMLNGTGEQQAAFDQVVVSVSSTTQVFEKRGNECHATSFTTLQSGQRLQIQTTGTVAQSYPPQVEATEIVILSN